MLIRDASAYDILCALGHVGWDIAIFPWAAGGGIRVIATFGDVIVEGYAPTVDSIARDVYIAAAGDLATPARLH